MPLDERTIVAVPGGRSRYRVAAAVVLAVALVAVSVVTSPGARTARAANLTRFSIDVNYGRMSGEGWTQDSWVTITIDDPTTPINPDIDDGFFLFGDSSFVWSPDFYPDPGDVVTVSDGVVTKTHVVTSLWVTDSDEAADTISGFATPGATVGAWVEYQQSTTQKWTTADGSGRWTFDYTGTRDLTEWDTMWIRELDDDGDGTELSVNLPVDPDEDDDGVLNAVDNCWDTANATQYDGDGDGVGMRCDDVDRAWGPNRYATAAAVSSMAFDTADGVLVALGTNFPDALVAAAVGGHEHLPVLLTMSNSLPAETIAEIIRLHPTTAYIVGGTAVIGPAVEQQLGTLVKTVHRLWGANRYETATAVSREFYPSATEVFVASGENFPDALVAASPAGFKGAPVLLTRRDQLPATTLAEINRLNPTTIYVIGGTAAISATTAGELAPSGTVIRLAGANRYETARAVADSFYGDDCLGSWAFLAYGGSFPDALVAAAAAGSFRMPVLLVEHDTIPAATRQALDHPRKGIVWIVGGRAVISDAVFNALP